jgi:hypothetical protein
MAGERISAGGNNLDFLLNLSKEKEFITVAAAEKKALFNYVPPKVTVDYQKKFDPAKAPIFRPTKTVVVSQDPPADQVVPAGTEIKVTLAAKGTLPVGSFQVAPGIFEKYGAGNIANLLKDLDEKGQAVVPILETEKAFELLSQPEKNAVTEYAHSIGLAPANDADSKAIFEDIQFFHNF